MPGPARLSCLRAQVNFGHVHGHRDDPLVTDRTSRFPQANCLVSSHTVKPENSQLLG